MHSSSDSLLIAETIGFRLDDGRTLFDGLSFGLGRERTGLVGVNGIGKTTLARLLTGALTPTRGQVLRNGSVGYLAQQRETAPRPDATVADALGVAPTLAILERVLAGHGSPEDLDAVSAEWDLPDRIARVMERLRVGHLPLDRPLGAVSGGEATRVSLARLLLEEPDFLILDEPTNHLDGEGRAALYSFVEDWTSGMLVVTHDRALLRRVDRILELSTLGARFYGGGYDSYVAQRAAEADAAERELAHARKELKKTQREIQATRERQERRASRGRKDGASGGMPKILLGRRKESSENTAGRLGKTAERQLTEAKGRAETARQSVEHLERLRLALPSTELRPGKVVLRASDVRFGYPGGAGSIVDGFSCMITGPERLALAGRNGSGKTTLLRLLAGELEPTAGTLTLGLAPERIAYLDQHAARLRPDASVLDNLRDAHPELDAQTVRYTLARFLFPGDRALARVEALSGGERLRAALACSLAARPPQLLLLDEPSNHLDLDSQRAVEEVLAAYDGALVVVSHDPDFLDAIGVERRLAVG